MFMPTLEEWEKRTSSKKGSLAVLTNELQIVIKSVKLAQKVFFIFTLQFYDTFKKWRHFLRQNNINDNANIESIS